MIKKPGFIAGLFCYLFDQPHAFREMDTGFDRTVSGFPVRDGDRAVRCRIGAFRPFQRTKMRIDPDLLESWFDRFDAKHMRT